jgi:hypothetical protein
MPKTVLIILFFFSFMLVQSQHKTKFKAKPKLSKVITNDSCVLFKKLISESWRLCENKNEYLDSLGLLYNETFKNCLIGKTRDEVFKLLGYPNKETIQYLSFSHTIEYIIYYTDPYTLNSKHSNEHYGFNIVIELDKNKKIKGFGAINEIIVSIKE